MITIEQLKELKQRLEEAEAKCREAEKKIITRVFYKKLLDKKSEALMHQLQEQAKEYLENENEDYKKLVEENYNLLRKEKLIYKVRYAAYSLIGTYSSAFEGRIRMNGLSYVQKAGTNLGIMPLSAHEYPKKIVGKVDYLGQIRLETKVIGYSVLRTLPSRYEGYVNKHGIIVLEVKQRDLELLDGHFVIGQLIGGHLNSEDAPKFYSNVLMLKRMLSGFVESL